MQVIAMFMLELQILSFAVLFFVWKAVEKCFNMQLVCVVYAVCYHVTNSKMNFSRCFSSYLFLHIDQYVSSCLSRFNIFEYISTMQV